MHTQRESILAPTAAHHLVAELRHDALSLVTVILDPPVSPPEHAYARALGTLGISLR